MTRWLVRARISPWVAPGALLAATLALYPSLGQQASPLVIGAGGLACVLFLASQMSNYITGQTLNVDGGILMD